MTGAPYPAEWSSGRILPMSVEKSMVSASFSIDLVALLGGMAVSYDDFLGICNSVAGCAKGLYAKVAPREGGGIFYGLLSLTYEAGKSFHGFAKLFNVCCVGASDKAFT